MSRFMIKELHYGAPISQLHLSCSIEPRRGCYKKKSNHTVVLNLKGRFYEVSLTFDKDDLYIMVNGFSGVVPCRLILQDNLKFTNLNSNDEDLVSIGYGCI